MMIPSTLDQLLGSLYAALWCGVAQLAVRKATGAVATASERQRRGGGGQEESVSTGVQLLADWYFRTICMSTSISEWPRVSQNGQLCHHVNIFLCRRHVSLELCLEHRVFPLGSAKVSWMAHTRQVKTRHWPRVPTHRLRTST